MAIEFNQKSNSNFNLNKVIVVIVLLAVLVIIFLFFKNGGFSSEKEEQARTQLFEPINIDFDLITSEDFKNLESFRGIPVLPGFFDASLTVTRAEVIENGRENPFKEVSQDEIDLAITKAIQKITNLEGIDEMAGFIQDSTLYTDFEKKSLLLKLDDQKKVIEKGSEEEPQGEEIVLDQEDEEALVIEKNEDKEIDYYKEW
ncbi:MAG: hypothetical protein PHY30_01485 [Candidatus Pacebacteria bacterium]|nr:hypothetical protein [Candidatus Paceibacterota bacterium]